MLRIIEGGFYSSAWEDVKNEILDLTKKGERTFLIVPEQQAVSAEGELVSILPPSAPLTFEVTNFTRLANTVARALGGISKEYSNHAKESLIMWRTLTELSPFLSITGGGEVSSGTVESALAAVREMKSISATPEVLAELAKSDSLAQNARLGGKLGDMAKIMTLYEKLLREKYQSTGDECERLAEKLSHNPEFFDGVHFYLSGFTSFTEPQYKVIRELLRGATVNVHLVFSKTDSESFEFTEIKKTKDRLKNIAGLVNAQRVVVRAHENTKSAPELLKEVCRYLWKNNLTIDNESLQNTDALRIFEASDPYTECDFVASDIKRRVMEGADFRDVAIVMRSEEKYSGILSSSLSAAGVPAFISKRTDLAAFEAVKLIYSAFATVEGGFKRGDVIAYAKCRLCGISREACDEFELYTDTWQISGGGFTEEVFWNMSPDGYSTRKLEGQDAILERIDKTRHALIAPLLKFRDALSYAKTVREYATVLVSFLSDISLEGRIAEESDYLRRNGETEAADATDTVFEIICNSLDALVEVLGDTEITLRAFAAQLKVVIGAVDIGKIPAHRDEVTVGTADMIRLTDKKHVYLLGVNQGEFPRSASPVSYFTERDKSVLSALGLLIETDTDIPYARELFFFSRAFSSATDSVTLLYSQRGEALTASGPSDVIGRISQMTDKKISPIKISTIPIEDKIYFPRMAFDFLDNDEVKSALAGSGYEDSVKISDGSIENDGLKLSSDTAASIYQGDIALTQTRIESYVRCPLSYYLEYNVRLSENERARFDARNIGTFIHAILEDFFGEISSEGKLTDEVSEDERTEIVKRSAKRFIESVSDVPGSIPERTSLLIDRLCRTAMPVVNGLCDELSGCKFTPKFFELKIDGRDERLPRPATFEDGEGNKVYIYGSIDRVDTYKSGDDVFVRVIDYKTGSKEFSPDDIDEGKNLQMFLYLKAIVDTDNDAFRHELGVEGDGRVIPAGVIYIKTDLSDVTVAHADRDSEEKALNANQKRRGMILDDSESIAAQNKDYLPVKFTKKGAPDSRYTKFLYTADGWDELGDKIGDKIREISERMRWGDISPTKESHACDSCKFKAICRKKD